MTIAERIRALRKQAPYRTQGMIAEALGVSVSYISEIERGLKTPRGEMLERLAEILGVSSEELSKESNVRIVQISATTGPDGQVRVACLLNDGTIRIATPEALETQEAGV